MLAIRTASIISHFTRRYCTLTYPDIIFRAGAIRRFARFVASCPTTFVCPSQIFATNVIPVVDARRQPLCFVLPSALKNDLQELHQIFSSEIVRPGDVLLNVFPKHQAEIEAYNYSVPVEKILDPPTFLRRLCGCRAVVSSRLHGVILALHAGVPTIAAWPAAEGNKVPGLMNDVLRFPDQFLLVDKSFTRKALDLRVAQVSIAYGVFGTQRLSEVFKRLDDIYRDTHEEGYRMLDGLLGLDLPDFIDTVDDSVAGEFWREKLYERDGEANVTTGSDAYRASAAKVSDTGQVSGGAGLSVTNAVEPAFNGEIVDVKRDGSLDKVQTGEGGKASAWTGAEVAPNTVEERPREEEVVSGIAEGAAEDEEKEKQTLAEKSWSKGAPPEAQSKEELPEATGEDRWEGAGSGTGTAKSADGNTAQEQKYSPGANVAVENSDSFFPNSPWTSSQGKEEIRQEPFPMAGHEGAFGGSWVCTLGALVLTALLGLPALSSLRKTEPYGNPVDRVPLVVEDGTVSTQTSPTAVLKISAPLRLHVPRLSGLVFFGVNYAIWVALAVGFNVCSRRYLHVTRNPVALLTIQGWVGIAVLWARNSLARCRRSSSRVASVSSTPSWAGRCGMRQVKSAGSKVWLAGLLHCCNAVLTSWLVLLGGIAVTHALKALEPIAAAAFSQWLLGSTLPPRRAAAVGVIVVGLGILTLPAHPPEWARGTQHPDFKEAAASVGDADIQLAISALITAGACCAVALRNVLLKGVNPPQPPPLALLVCSVVAAGVGSALLLLPWMPSSWESAGQPLLLASGVNASLCFVGYNLASFNLLSELSPVGHAVGNSSKGVCLFAAGLLLGKDRPISTRQLVGASAAFIGLASYNMAGVASSSSRKG